MPSALNSATRANQEAGTTSDAFNSPLRQQFHPSSTKAWVYYDNNTAFSASYNVSGNADNGPNNHTITWTIAFSSASYAAIACPKADASDTAISAYSAQISDSVFTTSTCQIFTTNSNGNTSVSEPNQTFVAAWGAQA